MLGRGTRGWLPLRWAGTHNNLGIALHTLGERESGTARLKGAVAAYRAALGVFSRGHVLLQWATTQNNLGNALSILGGRESGTARLEEAVAAYRAALGLCSMSVSLVEAKQVPVYGPYTLPSWRTMSCSTDCGYG